MLLYQDIYVRQQIHSKKMEYLDLYKNDHFNEFFYNNSAKNDI